MRSKEHTDKRTETHACVLISQQAAIGAVKKYYRAYDNDLLELITFDIERLPPAQLEPRWIPCSEKLPEKNCRCLTTNEALGAFEVDWNIWIDGQWLYPNEKPIAWMPLPEPYQSEAERRTDERRNNG